MEVKNRNKKKSKKEKPEIKNKTENNRVDDIAVEGVVPNAPHIRQRGRRQGTKKHKDI